MSHRLLIYDRDCKLYEEILLRRLPHLTIHSASRPEEASDFIEEVEIIFAWKIPDDLLMKAKRLLWYASMGAGNETLVNNPHLPASVALTKTTIYGEMMAEYVFAYLLHSIRCVPKHFEDQKKRVWDPARPDRLRGKVLGILGLGSIGQEIAKRGKQFGMKVLGVKRVPGKVENVDEVFGPEELEKMMPFVDYLVVVLPFTPKTNRLLAERELDMLKEGTILFNIGRGKTIDEGALIKILKKGKIKAVLDVFETEPLSKESELWDFDNVIITPHVSGINLPEEICDGFMTNYERWIGEEPLIGLVDRQEEY